MARSEIAELYHIPLGSVPSDLASTVDTVLRFAIRLPVVQHLQSCVLHLLPPAARRAFESAEPLRLHCPLPPDDSVSSRDTRNFIVECLLLSGSVSGEPTFIDDAGIISLTNVSISTLAPFLTIRHGIPAALISLRATTSASLSPLLDSFLSAYRAISTLCNTAVLRDVIHAVTTHSSPSWHWRTVRRPCFNPSRRHSPPRLTLRIKDFGKVTTLSPKKLTVQMLTSLAGIQPSAISLFFTCQSSFDVAGPVSSGPTLIRRCAPSSALGYRPLSSEAVLNIYSNELPV